MVHTVNVTSRLMLTFITWLRQCFSGFSTVKFFSLLFYITVFRWKSLYPTHILGIESYTSPLEGKVCIYFNHLEFFCKGDLSLLPHFLTYLIIYLHQYGLMHIYFIFWVTTDFYFSAQYVPVLAINNSFIWLLCPFDAPPSMSCVASLFFFGFLSTSLIASSIRFIFLGPFLEISHFSKDPLLL